MVVTQKKHTPRFIHIGVCHRIKPLGSDWSSGDWYHGALTGGYKQLAAKHQG
jgi:hypothetical protein